MPRSLRDRLRSEIGPRKLAKFFPGPAPNQDQGDDVLLDELVAFGLRKLAVTCPIQVGELLTVEQEGTSLSPIGPLAPRRISVARVLTAAGSRELPPAYRSDNGWAVVGSTFLCPSAQPGTSVYVVFNVVPSEAEIQANETYLQAVSRFAAAEALRRVVAAASREVTVVLEGVPDVRVDQSLIQTAAILDKAAVDSLDDYMAAL